MHHPADRTVHTTAFVMPVAVVEAGSRNNAMNPLGGSDLTTHCTMTILSATELRPAPRKLMKHIVKWRHFVQRIQF